jgi:hypothetical protein
MEVVIGRRVAHEEGHTCDLACSCTSCPFYFWRLFLEGAHVEAFFLVFLDILGGCTCEDMSCLLIFGYLGKWSPCFIECLTQRGKK